MPKFNGFQNDYSGLSQLQVDERLEQFGYNELLPEKKPSFILKVVSILKEPMFLLLFGTATMYFLLGEPRDGMIMLVFVVVMAGISLFQEWRTDQTLQALKDLSAPKARVIRNGVLHTIESRLVTVEDLLLLEEGDRIPADGLILEMFDLGMDESTLTGESGTVWKTLQTSDEDHQHFRLDHCYAGTTVIQGSAVLQVSAIGSESQYGKIGTDIMNAPVHPTPLEKQTRQIILTSGIIGIVLFILVLFITYKHTGILVHSILSGLTLAMAMIPEEFPVILTVFLAMGAWRLAYKNALIRRMPSVETLGAVSVLCVDKTGTLTLNQMAVQETYCHNEVSENDLLTYTALACEKEPYDPMEKALLAYARSKEIETDTLFALPFVKEYPFSSESKRMGHVWQNPQMILCSKGAPESIFPLCNLTESQIRHLGMLQEQMAEKGQRVIAVAMGYPEGTLPHDLRDAQLQFLGLIGLMDPPREEIPAAIDVCKAAGVRVVMITGDHGTTAMSIAHKIGLTTVHSAITGVDLAHASDDELITMSKDASLFVRVLPSQKMRIVKALKSNGAIVAMTGDGVNDATALKYADIGIAMGKRGTGVAKEAADMILLDDNFTTIVDTIHDGRRIYDNIKKAIGYVFVIHIPIALMALAAPFFHLPLLLLPIHIVILELIIDPTCSVIFERHPAEDDIMLRPPRNPKAPLLSLNLLGKALAQGLTIFAATFGSYAYLLQHGSTVELARTFTLVVFGVSNLLLVYVNQSDHHSAIYGLYKFKDQVIWYVNCGVLIALALITYTPIGNFMAKTEPLSPTALLAAIALAAASTLWWDVVKLFHKTTAKTIN